MMDDEAKVPRSVLYLPANRDGAVAKARTLPADAVILDLEDAVQPTMKDAARAAAVAAAAAGGWQPRRLLLRVNGLGTGWAAADFAAAAGFDGVVVPKVDGPADAARAVAMAGGKPIWAMIETPRAVIAAPAIAAVPGVAALLAGTNDLTKDLRLPADAGRTGLLHALSGMVLAARAAGVFAFDGVFGAIGDDAGFRAEAEQGRRLGFDGKTLVHPSQVVPCNEVFSPSADAIADAEGLIAAYAAGLAEGHGVTTWRGRMIEELHVAEARRLLRDAAR